MIIVLSRPITITGIGNVSSETIALIGVQLTILGVLGSAHLIVPRTGILKDRAFARKIVSLLPLVSGCIVALEGLIIASYSNTSFLSNGSGIRQMFMALFGAQLFFFGAAELLFWLERKRSFSRKFISIVQGLVLVSISSAGVLLIGLASPLYIAKIGSIMEGTVRMAGVQLTILGIVAMTSSVMSEHRIMKRQLIGLSLSYLLMLAVGFIISAEGLLIVSFGSDLTLASVGGLMARTMDIGGGAVFLLGFLTVLTLGLTAGDRLFWQKVTASFSSLFLLLLLPLAVLL